MKLSHTLVAAATVGQTTATLNLIGDLIGGIDKFICPGVKPIYCDPAQKKGFDWKSLAPGPISGYGGVNFSNGWSVKGQGSIGKNRRDMLSGREASSEIEADVGPASENSPMMTAGDEVNVMDVQSFEVASEQDARFEFHYIMPDGSICKQSAMISQQGTSIQNTQCGGAKAVKFVLPEFQGHDAKNKRTLGLIKKLLKLKCQKIKFWCKPPPTGVPPIIPPKTTIPPIVVPTTTPIVPPVLTTTPIVPPVLTTTPIVPPVLTTTPVVPPVKTTTPIVPPEESTTPIVPPVKTTTPIVPPEESTTPIVPPVKTTTPIVPPEESTTPIVPPVKTTTPIVPPEESTTPIVPPVKSTTSVITTTFDRTSTIYTSSTMVISTCNPEIETTSCPILTPGETSTVVVTVPVSSTVTPVTETRTSTITPPVIITEPTPIVSTTVVNTVSTIYSTSVVTITSCGPEVTSCPIKTPGETGTVVVTVPVGSTTRPVTVTHTPVVPPVIDTINPPPVIETINPPPVIDTVNPPVDEKTKTTPPVPKETNEFCPPVVGRCVETWLHKVPGAQTVADKAKYCKDSDFAKNINQCIYAHGGDDKTVAAAINCFVGVCAKEVGGNPDIVIGGDEISNIITATPVVPTGQVTTITIDTTITYSTTTRVVSTSIVAPVVGVTPMPTSGNPNPSIPENPNPVHPGKPGKPNPGQPGGGQIGQPGGGQIGQPGGGQIGQPGQPKGTGMPVGPTIVPTAAADKVQASVIGFAVFALVALL